MTFRDTRLVALLAASLVAGCIGVAPDTPSPTPPVESPLPEADDPVAEASSIRTGNSREDWWLKVNSSEWNSPEVSKASSIHAPSQEEESRCSPWGGPDTRVGEIETLTVHAWGDPDARNDVYITIAVPEGFAVLDGPLYAEGRLDEAPIRFNLTLRAEAPGCWIVKIGSGYIGGGIVRDREFVYRVTNAEDEP